MHDSVHLLVAVARYASETPQAKITIAEIEPALRRLEAYPAATVRPEDRAMAQVVQATCPGCKSMLRIPADWVQQTLRCKKCGKVVQLPQRPAAPAPFAPSTSNEVRAAQPLPNIFAPIPARPEGTGIPFDSEEPIIRVPLAAQQSKRRRPVMLLLAGVLLLVLASAVTYQVWPAFSNSAATIPAPPRKDPPVNLLPERVVFPRRALAISVSHYLYANPVSSPNLHDLMQQIARALHVQASQMVELSDVAAPKPSRKSVPEKPARNEPRLDLPTRTTLPLKPVIEKTIRSFVETSRPQDRILLLWIGHVVEIGPEAYLVPLEGEPEVAETLIPLRWLYEQLSQCKARQKVLILDTCRFDPSRGLQRPGSGPMSATLDARLQNPPAGVQLWSACTSGQYSYESFGSAVFLDKLYDTLTASVLKKVEGPQDPLPIEILAQVVNQSTAAEVAIHIAGSDGQKAMQTPRVTGQMAEQGAPYDKDEPSPRLVEIPAPATPAGGVAKQEQIQSIVQEIDLPPIKLGHQQDTPLEIAGLLPFSAEAIERYQPDYTDIKEVAHNLEKYPLRVPVIETIQLLRATFDPKGPQGSLREYFQGTSNDRIKSEILKEQRKPAEIHDQLLERLEALRKAGEQRQKEPSPRWQAHYDYVLAQLLARTAYISEYNLMLGKIRKDELPELRPSVHTGWRLASCEKLQSGKEVKELAAESKKLFTKLIHDHPGTPWAMLAKRARLTALGLEWQPSS